MKNLARDSSATHQVRGGAALIRERGLQSLALEAADAQHKHLSLKTSRRIVFEQTNSDVPEFLMNSLRIQQQRIRKLDRLSGWAELN